MARRRRLSPANPEVFGAAPETKSMLPRAPIADVAADAASTAALQDVSHALQAARAEGRMVLALPVAEIVLDHIVRDRLVADEAEMAALMGSIEARGQQTPIEVLALPAGGYGLISGWRRCQAIAHLAREGRHDGQVLALLRRPADASETYQAMVEENEIRVGLSHFERARIVARAVDEGVFESHKQALQSLFRSASRAKRSKIRAFLPLVAELGGALRFPHLIGERLGLRISAVLEADSYFAERVTKTLKEAAVETAEGEQKLLEESLKRPGKPALTQPKPAKDEGGKAEQTPRPGVRAEWRMQGDWLLLKGPQLTPALRGQILDLIRRHRPR